MNGNPVRDGRKPRIAFLVTVDWYFANHYLALAQAIHDAGYAVSVITTVDKHAETIAAAGIDVIPVRISRKGMHPVAEFRSLVTLIRILWRLRPDLLHAIAQKPVLYGSLAAKLTGNPARVCALPGLGWLFTSNDRLARLGRAIVLVGYRTLLRGERVRVMVQNETDRAELERLAGLRAVVVPGSGVDLERYRPGPRPARPVTIMLASRLLWNKGVAELVDAARILKQRNVVCRCCLIGRPDADNPASVPERWLQECVDQDLVEWWGFRDDMAEVLKHAHIACLPSYREGMPKFLLEASAAGLPLVAADVPGCRDIVQSGRNGLLVPPRDAGALADSLQRLIEDPALRTRLGRNARKIAEERFGSDRVANAVKALYGELLGRPF